MLRIKNFWRWYLTKNYSEKQEIEYLTTNRKIEA